jgi:PHD/YefM family antitoxin component YafN of YafNO toxin-antitoxin module
MARLNDKDVVEMSKQDCQFPVVITLENHENARIFSQEELDSLLECLARFKQLQTTNV